MPIANDEYEDFINRAAEAKPGSDRFPFWEVGRYLVCIDRAVLEKKFTGTFFIIEGDILESNVESRPPGMRCAQLLKSQNVATGSNIQEFVCACFRKSPEQVDKVFLKKVINNPENLFLGRVLRLDCRNQPTKTGGEYTRHYWKAVDQIVQDRVDELREKAGLEPY